MITVSSPAMHWNELSKGYDSVMSSDPSYRKLLMQIIELIPPRATTVLDLGCGTGALSFICSRSFPDAHIIGIDPAPKMIEKAEALNSGSHRIHFEEGNAAELEHFKSNSFDAVISNFALHHLEHSDKKICARQVYRVLKPGGRFIFGDQHCRVMGEVSDPERVLHTLELLTYKARYYFLNAGMARMLLQLELLPRFIKQDGEILATPEFWVECLEAAGFQNAGVHVIAPEQLMNRVIWGTKPGPTPDHQPEEAM